MDAFRSPTELATLRKMALEFLGFDHHTTLCAIYGVSDQYTALQELIGEERTRCYLDAFLNDMTKEANRLRDEIRQRLESMRIGTFCTPRGVIAISRYNSPERAREIGAAFKAFRDGRARGDADNEQAEAEVTALNELWNMDPIDDDNRNNKGNQE